LDLVKTKVRRVVTVNGSPRDHPLSDLFLHGAHPFPPDVEELIRRLADIDPLLLGEIDRDVFEWQAGRQLDEGREKLRELIAKARPNPDVKGPWPW
jgi:hypothetical protein